MAIGKSAYNGLQYSLAEFGGNSALNDYKSECILSLTSVSGNLTFPDKTKTGMTLDEISLIAWNKLSKIVYTFFGAVSINSWINGAKLVVKTGLS